MEHSIPSILVDSCSGLVIVIDAGAISIVEPMVLRIRACEKTYIGKN
jgi:hypothetical protein